MRKKYIQNSLISARRMNKINTCPNKLCIPNYLNRILLRRLNCILHYTRESSIQVSRISTQSPRRTHYKRLRDRKLCTAYPFHLHSHLRTPFSSMLQDITEDIQDRLCFLLFQSHSNSHTLYLRYPSLLSVHSHR